MTTYRDVGQRAMKTNGPSAASAAAAAVAGILAHPARRATPETLSVDSTITHQPTVTTDNAEPGNTAQSQVCAIYHAFFVHISTGMIGKYQEQLLLGLIQIRFLFCELLDRNTAVILHSKIDRYSIAHYRLILTLCPI